ncbi:hypothetical protein PLICRDRAFT_350446 [Plicaturopsis crispa FD-325 SS-3]|uniref:Uncharacterized protein n=1 Tax=Plicaturopsis crispa FD-325 SS-3 TaxID=944288 RepID=A0A0C9SRS5_PLICR|nr:hypothetical protein PLICRDRAFT_350446 [Plicaturopsis crispa FD-325 SS-3]
MRRPHAVDAMSFGGADVHRRSRHRRSPRRCCTSPRTVRDQRSPLRRSHSATGLPRTPSRAGRRLHALLATSLPGTRDRRHSVLPALVTRRLQTRGRRGAIYPLVKSITEEAMCGTCTRLVLSRRHHFSTGRAQDDRFVGYCTRHLRAESALQRVARVNTVPDSQIDEAACLSRTDRLRIRRPCVWRAARSTLACSGQG